MIQRIQSIFLLLAAGCFAGLFWIPLALSDTSTGQFFADGVFTINDHPALLALAILGIVLALAAIFAYRKRTLQLRLVYMTIILGILSVITAFLLFRNESVQIAASTIVEDQFGLYLPLGAVLLGLVANYFIRKDDRLVKSMDRLR